MDLYDERIKLNKFKFRSTYRDAYMKYPPAKRTVPDVSRPPCKFEVETKPHNITVEAYKDNETFQYWRPNMRIPFNLLWKPRDIIDKPLEYNLPNDTKDKDYARKTRPRIYMSPAVSVDDIDDPEIRETILGYMYTSNTAKASQDLIETTKFKPKSYTSTTITAKSDAVKFEADLLPPLPENFRNKGKDWEHNQLRALVDPTESFWKRKAPTIKGPLDDQFQNLVNQEVKDEIRKLIIEDKLRQPHDKTIPGHTGYQPRSSEGIALRKNDIDVTQPILSTYQAITKHYHQ